MKSSKDIIISFIRDLYSKNNNLMMRYEYNQSKEKHFVEILSKTDDFDLDSIWELKYDISRLIKNEFGETVLFLTNESLSKICSPIFEMGYNSFMVTKKTLDFSFDFNSWISSDNYSLAA